LNDRDLVDAARIVATRVPDAHLPRRVSGVERPARQRPSETGAALRVWRCELANCSGVAST
jgi:hypothetical protein